MKRRQLYTQQFNACATVHRTLQRFESIDLSLNLPIAPGLCTAAKSLESILGTVCQPTPVSAAI